MHLFPNSLRWVLDLKRRKVSYRELAGRFLSRPNRCLRVFKCIKHTSERAKESDEGAEGEITEERQSLWEKHAESSPCVHMLKKKNKDRNCYISISVLNTHSIVWIRPVTLFSETPQSVFSWDHVSRGFLCQKHSLFSLTWPAFFILFDVFLLPYLLCKWYLCICWSLHMNNRIYHTVWLVFYKQYIVNTKL